MSKRIQYLDIAKGLLIMLLVISHYVSAHNVLNISHDYIEHIDPWLIIYRCFFMQAFFIISGYCTNFDKPFTLFFKTQIKQLIIPWITFEIFYATISVIWDGDISFSYFISKIFNERWTVLWFLNALFFSKTIVWITRKITKSQFLLLSMTSILLIIGVLINKYDWGKNIFCIRESLASTLFVAIGLYLRSHQSIYRLLLNWCIYIYILALLIFTSIGIHIPVVAAGLHVTLKQIPIFLLMSLTGTFACLKICELIAHNSFFEYWGRNSLIVYGTHFMGLQSFVLIFYTLFSPINKYNAIPYYFLIYLFEFIYCWIMIKIFTSKYLKWTIGSF